MRLDNLQSIIDNIAAELLARGKTADQIEQTLVNEAERVADEIRNDFFKPEE